MSCKWSLSVNRGSRVLGAYRATPVRVLEAEPGINPIQISLDQAVLRRLSLRGVHPATKVGNEQIRAKLRPRKGRPKAITQTLSEEKEEWALRVLRTED